MRFFIDTADIDEIKEFIDTGVIDGVTTNPSLVAKTGRSFLELIEEIARLVQGPVSAEVVSQERETMISQGRILGQIAPNVVIKVPLTIEGLKACRQLREEGFSVNVTLCFSCAQALLAAKAGASFLSPFMGRLDDASYQGAGLRLIEEISTLYQNYSYSFDTKILVASIRSPEHLIQVAKFKADCVTIPPPILRKAFQHPLTDIGLEIFEKAWQANPHLRINNQT